MTDLFFPGDDRAGSLISGPALVAAMVEVERAWLEALVAAGIAPDTAAGALSPGENPVAGLLPELAAGAEAGGNPVIGLVKQLRAQLSGSNPAAARWLHRGLTSQDVLDTALMLCLREVLERVGTELDAQIRSLTALAGRHRDTVMAGRTLTQYAVPTTFGLKAAGWLGAVLDARDALDRLPAPPAQFGGAAGTLSAVLELARHRGLPDPVQRVRDLVADACARLDLPARPPWHTARGPVTATGDVLVGCCDAWGRIARDVIELGRPEIAELAEPARPGRGGSSTMAHKRNPVLSVLIRRTALSAPQWAATLHLAAAEAVDERPDGAWHAEWPALHSLARASVSAAAQTTELLAGLQVDPQRMRAGLDAAGAAILGEQASMAALFDHKPEDPTIHGYLGLATVLVDEVLARAASGRAAARPDGPGSGTGALVGEADARNGTSQNPTGPNQTDRTSGTSRTRQDPTGQNSVSQNSTGQNVAGNEEHR